MVTSRKLLVCAVSALAISALPIKLDASSIVGFAKAYAKSENGGGNDKGGGNDRGGGGDRGKGGGSSNGKSASAGGKSDMFGGSLKSLFGGGQTKKASLQDSKQKGPKHANATQKKAPVADVLQASVPGKQKNLNARLAGLNSLKRNYHAYLNSQSPRMALIREYVINSAKLDLAVEAAAAAQAKADAAQLELDAAMAALGGITPYDGAAPVSDPAALQDRLDALTAAGAPVDPAQLEAYNAELDALSDAIAAADSLATAEQEAADAQATADAAAEGTTEEDLREALLAAANQNRVAEYGDAYLDDGVLDWAKDVLGVGDAYGKIDQVKEVLAEEAAAETPAVEPEPTAEPVVEPAPTLVLAPAN